MLCYNPVTAGKIINSCIMLHNILIGSRVADDEVEDYTSEANDEHSDNGEHEDEYDEDEYEDGAGTHRRSEDNGFLTRNLLVQQYFSNV